MRNAALIRTYRIGDVELSLKEKLESYFGTYVYFVLENFHDKAERELRGNAGTVMNSAFLKQHGLTRFLRAGWQCGDYSYYAGATAFPEHEFYWLVEPDVGFTFSDVGDFFRCFEQTDADLLMYSLSSMNDKWHWYASIEALSEGNVYGGPFALTRMSRNGALHLLNERSRYCQSDAVRSLPQNFKGGPPFANDESFTASILKRDGFSLQALEELSVDDALTGATFSTLVPIMPDELALPQNHNKIYHPVCDAKRAGPKLRRLKDKNPTAFSKRRQSIISLFGAKAWEAWSGLPATPLV